MTAADKVEAEFSRFPKREYSKGQIVIFGGEEPEAIFYITKGRVRQYDISYRGDEIIINTFKPPAFFPMSWALNKTPNKYFYKAETETELHIIPVAHAVDFVTSNPDVLIDLLARLYRGMDGLLGRVVHLMSGSAQSRVLYELIIEAQRFGQANDDGSYSLATSKIDLAARSGLTRETVSRQLHKLKTENLVAVTNKGITITDIQALKAKLGDET